MTAETPKQRFRRVAAKIADSVTIAINVKRTHIRASIVNPVGACCCPIGAVEAALEPGIGGVWYPTSFESAKLLGCREAEARAFIIGFECLNVLDNVDRGQAQKRYRHWVNLGKAYRERFVAP